MEDFPSPWREAREQPLEIRFSGSGSEYFRIWIVNLLLTVVTLGLYYPFAKVRRLRYFHAATEVGGAPLSFHADPWKLLRGYLLVGVLLGAYSLASRLSPVAGLVAFLIVTAIWPALWHSSLRFRLHNTGWRGLRLGFNGTRAQAYKTLLPAFLPALAIVLYSVILIDGEGGRPGTAASAGFFVLMLAVLASTPVQLWWIKRYQHGHYTVGAECTSLKVTLGRFLMLFVRGFGVSLAGLLAMMLMVTLLALLLNGARSELARNFGPYLAGAAGFLAFQAVVWPYFASRLQNLVWNGTRSEHLRFESHLGFRRFAWLCLKNWCLVICTLGLYLPFARVASVRMRLQAMQVLTTVDPAQLFDDGARQDEAAAGDAAGDFFGVDLGL